MPVRKQGRVLPTRYHELLFPALVYTFFKERNLLLRRDPNFVPSENCGEFEKHYQAVFG